ncbi:MAG: hypothetical protein ACO37W_09420 [Prochlorotrichaceae cyanobacterium]
MNQAYQLHYQIQKTPQGVILKIWEALSEDETARMQRSNAFLFRLNFRVDTIEAAHHLLRQYLKLIGVSDIQEMFMDEVQFVKINPGATEEFVPDVAFPYDRDFGRQL